MAFRFSTIVVVFSALYGLLVLNLYNLQLEKGRFYSAKAENQLKLAGFFEPIRGNIYFTDKRGSLIPAAINKDFPFVYAVPKEIEDAPEAAELLASVIGTPLDFLSGLLQKRDDPYEPLILKASQAQIDAVKQLGLKGVYTDEQPARFYPLETLGAHLLGFISTNGASNNRPIGQYGIERFYDKKLTGKEGAVVGDLIQKSEAGENIALTIDRNIQARGEEIIDKLVADFKAVSGSFIVQEPKTGKIIAMGGAPGFDPNNYSQANIKNFINQNVQGVYEPGSVFKVVTMAAGLDSGVITPETTYTDTGSVTLNGRTIKNWDLKAHGVINMNKVLEQSLNTGAIFVQRRIGQDKFRDYVRKFGFGEISGIDLPGEQKGSLAPIEGKGAQDINFATASFGQGVSVTPIQMINAVSAIANGGVLMRPYLNTENRPQIIGRAVSENSAKKTIAMMVSAVDKIWATKINGFGVAGKTGTAYVPDFKRGGYTDEVINTYVGFAPAADPQFTILIKLDKPAGAPLAAATVLPAFREFAEFIIGYYNIKPDRISPNL